MIAVIFYAALILIIAMLAIEYFDLHLFRHRVFSDLIHAEERQVRAAAAAGRKLAAKAKLENVGRAAAAAGAFIKREAVYLKKRFDSQQPKFLLAQHKPSGPGGHAVSFFLRSVAEHKEALKKKKQQ